MGEVSAIASIEDSRSYDPNKAVASFRLRVIRLRCGRLRGIAACRLGGGGRRGLVRIAADEATERQHEARKHHADFDS
jgi:hypothetical protein